MTGGAWVDRESTSLRPDGAKVGAFLVAGRLEWWTYPAGWTLRGGVPASGPWRSCDDAKTAADTALFSPA